MNKLLELSKESKKVVKWLLKATSKDTARTVLASIKAEDKKAIAANGFVLHVADVNPFEDTGLKKVVQIGSEFAETVEDQGTFPEWEKVLMENRTPRFCFFVSPRLLRDSIEGMDDRMVKITLYDPYSPIVVDGNVGGFACKAIIMPMQGNEKEMIPSRAQVEAEKKGRSKGKKNADPVP